MSVRVGEAAPHEIWNPNSLDADGAASAVAQARHASALAAEADLLVEVAAAPLAGPAAAGGPARLAVALVATIFGWLAFALESRRAGRLRLLAQERAARASEDKFRNLWESSRDAQVMFFPPVWKLTGGNTAAVTLFGSRDATHLATFSLGDLSPKRQPDGELSVTKVERMLGQALSEGSVFFEWVHRRMDGTEFPCEVSLTRTILDGKTGVQASIRNITTRKVAEAALMRTRNTLARAQEVGQVGSFEFLPASQTFEWSATQKQMYGLAPDTRSPSFEWVVAQIHPDDRGTVLQLWKKFLQGDEPGALEYRTVLPDGSLRWLSMRAELDRNEHGELLRVVGTTRDITDHKRLEQALIDERDNLEEIVQLRTRDLEQAKEAAESATRVKSDFLTNMSHEVRTPMSVIIGYADALLDPDSSYHDRKVAAAAIRRNGQHLLQVVNDVLDLSRIEAGKMPVEMEDCDPWDMLQAVIELYQVQATEKQIELTLAAEGPVPRRIRTDPTRARQILMNLLSNALKFTESGKQISVAMSVQQTPRFVCFSVTDQGIGMTPEQVSRLFKPFEQADSSTTRKYGGTGLGLSISKLLAEALGGTMEVQSSLGLGSTFQLLLPLAQSCVLEALPTSVSDQPTPSARLTIPASEPSSARPASGGRILLVEDSLDLQKLMAYRLLTAGYDVTTAANGRIGMELALQQPFEVILMDIQMPVMDGVAATRELRQAGYTAPIIGLSAHAMKGEREKNLAQGMNEYLTKPVDTDVLVATLQRFMQAGSYTAWP